MKQSLREKMYVVVLSYRISKRTLHYPKPDIVKRAMRPEVISSWPSSNAVFNLSSKPQMRYLLFCFIGISQRADIQGSGRQGTYVWD